MFAAPISSCDAPHSLVSPVPDECLQPIDTDRPHQTDTPHTVPAGHVRIEPARVAGLMRAPAPIDALIPAGAGAWLRVDLDYDTGIR